MFGRSSASSQAACLVAHRWFVRLFRQTLFAGGSGTEFLSPFDHGGAGGVWAAGVFLEFNNYDLALGVRDDNFGDGFSKLMGDVGLECVPFFLPLCTVCPVSEPPQ